MTLAATVWAVDTPAAQTPFERLLLILLADATDDHGVCVTRLSSLAETARLTLDEVRFYIHGLRRRGVLCGLKPVEGVDPDFEEFDILFFSGWLERIAMSAKGHPTLGPIFRHPCYGWVALT